LSLKIRKSIYLLNVSKADFGFETVGIEDLNESKRDFNQTIRCDLDHDHSTEHCDHKHNDINLEIEHRDENIDENSHRHLKHDHCDSHDHNHGHGDHHHDHSHDHGHDHSDHHHDNVNLRAALIHIIGDIIQSVGVVIASIIIYFNEHLYWVDPLCTFLFSIIVIMTTYNITKQCLAILMEANNNSDVVISKLQNKFKELKHIHNIHQWELSTGKPCISFHAVGLKETSVSSITNYLYKDLKYIEATVQLETDDDYTLCIKK
jgi:zinc transporter 2